MSKNKKQYKVVVQYDVQKTYYVQANNSDEAQEKETLAKGISKPCHENWEYHEVLECKEVA